MKLTVLHSEGEHLRVPYIAHLESIRRNWRADFCLCTRPRDNNMDEAVQDLCDDVFSVGNPKRWGLLRRPLSVCMITKTCDESWTDSMYEMGVWFSAQWTMLEDLEAELVEPAPGVSSGFLPGIIVHGHTWYLVAATRGPRRDDRSRKPVIWRHLVIGNTADVEGIVKIFTTLQRLASWSAFEYWPQVRRAVEQPMLSDVDEY
jgi:hypothetical protein